MGGGVFSFPSFQKKGEGSDFSHKNGGVCKIGGFFVKRRGGYHFLLYKHCVCYLFLSVLCACFSQEEPNLIASN